MSILLTTKKRDKNENNNDNPGIIADEYFNCE
jgi:hypothetical protein